MLCNDVQSNSQRPGDEKAAKRQSRVAQFNILSKAPASFKRHRRISSSTGASKEISSRLDNVDKNEFSHISDPISAESPSLTPSIGPTRIESQVSLSSMVRSEALASPAGVVISVPFPSKSSANSSSSSIASQIIPNRSALLSNPIDTYTESPPSTISLKTSLKRMASSRRLRATTLDVPGLTRSKMSPDGCIAKDDIGAKLVIVMVGLPARGKSYITKKLARFLNWQQHDCRIFNVGNTRRRASRNAGPSKEPLPDEPDKEGTEQKGDFFSPDNPRTVAQREKWAEDTLEELLEYILDGAGSVGILDATNTTRARRKRVMNIIKERSHGQLKVLFLESICTHSHIIESNVRLKLSGPDYRDMDQSKAIEDFLLRLRNYEKAYEPISSEEEADPLFQYVKFINVGQKFECGNIKGFLSGQTVFFLLNFNLLPRQIWITRHGESVDNQLGRIGGDAGLTNRGQRYAAAVAKFMKFKKEEFRNRLIKESADQLQILRKSGSRPPTPTNEPINQNFCVWTSMLRRTIETANHFEDIEFDVKEMRMLNELDPGICNGMTYQEIKSSYPHEYEARMKDKIRYRYPGIGGESYLDVINRLRPVIVEMERMEDNCLVICHRVVARILLSYFMNLGRDAIGDLEVPLHTLYVLEPKPYGVDWALYKYNERVNWFYEVSPEDSQVKSQLNDHKRRYTVVATAGMKLGDDSLWIPGKGSLGIDSLNAIASSSDDHESDSDDHDSAEFADGTRFQQNSLHTKPTTTNNVEGKESSSLDEKMEKHLTIN